MLVFLGPARMALCFPEVLLVSSRRRAVDPGGYPADLRHLQPSRGSDGEADHIPSMRQQGSHASCT